MIKKETFSNVSLMLTVCENEPIKLCTCEDLPSRGVYILIILIKKRSQLRVGALGYKTFSPGYYSYTGSAMGKGSSSLPLRVSRHQGTKKKVHWHIDYLLNNKNSSLEAVIVLPSEEKIECRVNQLVKRALKAETLVPKLGASDCTENCDGHLLFFPEYERTDSLIRKIANHLGHAGMHTLYIMRCNNEETDQPGTNNMVIKKAEILDLEELEKIERECFISEAFSKDQIASILQNLDSISLVAEINGEAVGFILGLFEENHGKRAGHVHTLDVVKKARKKGIGRSLLKRFEEVALQKGAGFCYLEVRTDNAPALELYRKMGYREKETLPHFYGIGKDGIRLIKNLLASLKII